MVNPFDPKAALLAKHAQHVVLIHFPIALFLTGFVFDLTARWTKNSTKKATMEGRGASQYTRRSRCCGADARIRHRGLAVATRGTEAEGAVIAPPGPGTHVQSFDLLGWGDPFSAAESFQSCAFRLLFTAGTPDRRHPCSYRSSGRFSEWRERSWLGPSIARS